MANVIVKDLFERMADSILDATVPAFDAEMGARLKIVRTKMGLKQKELADKLGLSQVEMSRLESGKKINALPKCSAFKNVLTEHFEYFLTRSGYHRYEDIKVRKDKQTRGKVFY